MSKKHSVEDIILYLKIKDNENYKKQLKESKRINTLEKTTTETIKGVK